METREINNLIKRQLELKNWSIKDLAEKTEYSYSHIQQLIIGSKRWNIDTLTNVAKVLGIKIEMKLIETPIRKKKTG